jgi:hypothetical protein
MSANHTNVVVCECKVTAQQPAGFPSLLLLLLLRDGEGQRLTENGWRALSSAAGSHRKRAYWEMRRRLLPPRPGGRQASEARRRPTCLVRALMNWRAGVPLRVRVCASHRVPGPARPARGPRRRPRPARSRRQGQNYNECIMEGVPRAPAHGVIRVGGAQCLLRLRF